MPFASLLSTLIWYHITPKIYNMAYCTKIRRPGDGWRLGITPKACQFPHHWRDNKPECLFQSAHLPDQYVPSMKSRSTSQKSVNDFSSESKLGRLFFLAIGKAIVNAELSVVFILCPADEPSWRVSQISTPPREEVTILGRRSADAECSWGSDNQSWHCGQQCTWCHTVEPHHAGLP